MDRIIRMNKVQNEAVKAALTKDKCTLLMATGTGKTFTAFKYLYELLSKNKIQKKDKIWFLAETTVRKYTLEEEECEFNVIYGYSLFEDFDIEFHCYQGKPEGNPVVIIADEIHFALTQEYSKVLMNTTATYLLGLTATIPYHLEAWKGVTKGELLKKIAPIAFEYSLEEAVKDGIVSPYKTTILIHELDYKIKNLLEVKRGKEWPTTEYHYYKTRDKIRKNLDINSKYKTRKIAEMTRLLWNLPSKVEPARNLLNKLSGKTIVFAAQLTILRQLLSDDLIVSGTDSEGKNKTDNDSIINKFNSGEITVIGSCKKLKQGITLEGVENCIILSYNKESWHTIQMLGRIVRFVPDKVANLYIFKTKNTLEGERWFKNINKIRNEKGNIVGVVDLNIHLEVLSSSIL